MNLAKRYGFTLIELLVVIAIIAADDAAPGHAKVNLKDSQRFLRGSGNF